MEKINSSDKEGFEKLERIIDEVRAEGRLVSAMAAEYGGKTSFLSWYTFVTYMESKDIVFLGAVIRMCKERDESPLSKNITSNYGKLNKIIFKRPNITLRNLNLEERARFEEGYNNYEKYREEVDKRYSQIMESTLNKPQTLS